MHFGNLRRGEIIAFVGAAILAVAVFLAWYGTDPANPNSKVKGKHGDFSAWDVHQILRFLLLAAAAAPIILAYIVIRDHKLSWPRGQMTAVVAIIALGLIGYSGIVNRPGEPSSTISLQPGWFLALVGAILMLVGATIRQGETEAARKPPGVL